MASDDVVTGGDVNLDYTLQELGQSMFDIKVRIAGDEKKIQSNRFAQEAFERQQTQWNKSMDDHMTRLINAVENLAKKPPDAATPSASASTPRGWKIPPSTTIKPVGFNQDSWPKLKMDPPRFNGEGVVLWIKKIQKFYNHSFTPLSDRLYLTEFLLDEAAEEWFEWWESNNTNRDWDDFLLDIKRRFDPDLYEDYVGRLATLRQTGSLEAYLTEFEPVLRKVSHVGDDTLTSLFIAGLSSSLKHELLIRRPASLSDAIALAQQLAACQAASNTSQSQRVRSAWQPRDFRQQQKPASPALKPADAARLPSSQPRQQREPTGPTDYPVVRVSAAERADRTKRGLCWYCPEPYSRSHVCSKKFYALMGDDEESESPRDEEDSSNDEEAENMVISGDVSRVLVIGPKLRPRSIRVTGMIYEAPVSVLIDGGSTHNFIKPAVAEQLSLSLHTISPFRVFVGNGASLRCDYVSLNTPIYLQGTRFDIDLFLLQVEGPDVILGVQWLQDLGKVLLDFRDLTMEFNWNQSPVMLKGEDRPPKRISYNNLFSLIGQNQESEIFEIVSLSPTSQAMHDPQADVDPALSAVIDEFAGVFDTPTGLPPARCWDHRIHLPQSSKPVNVRPYRYPHFQKAEIERQVRDMLSQGVIQHSTSPFSSPVLLVRKKDGSFRFCVDYRALNAATTPDHFPIPTADELFDELHAAVIFSKLDLRSGYHQIRMHVNDIHKTAFRTHDGHFEFLVMPFGLTNAPSTFQAAMNGIFKPFLRRFVIVFFDDILVYSNSAEEHLSHLREVLLILQSNAFFIKKSKCAFGVSTIDYLGHIISAGKLKVDPAKIEAMLIWPTPTNLKRLRGFLGLTGYYRRFVQNYSVIASPLTELLKKDSFIWSEAAAASFVALKEAMSSTPVLRLPDFSLPFVIETDASDFGVGAVLMQQGHPIAYFSKKLGPRRRVASTYHKELYAIVEAVQKWRQYLLGREFTIRTDQRSLKELLSQVVQTPDQQFYVRKLMGFKFTIEYKSGASNKVADALSRRDDDGPDTAPKLFALFARPIPTVIDTIRRENAQLSDLLALHQAVASGESPPHISVSDGLLYFKRRVYVSRDSLTRQTILGECHDSPTAGHPGERRTLARVAAVFYWPGLRRDVHDYVAACFTCQSTKYVRDKPNGLIQPLPIPSMVWEAASMDFIVGLPPSQGYTAVMVVVDRLSKYAHFGALKPGFDAPRVARLFVDTVVKLHGFPAKLLSDRDPIFMSDFWGELLKLSGTKLQFTTAYHPQTDGQSEVTNRALEQYLRAFTFDRPARWFALLPWAELALNCSVNASIGMSPFQALYGREPPNLFATYPRPSHNAGVEELLTERQDTLRVLKQRIARSQQSMAEYANRHRRDVEFSVGDRVLLKLQPYRQISVSKPGSNKLARRYFGPYEITERVGKVAYRLLLPADSRIHNVFHVSLLKKFVPFISATMDLPTSFRRSDPYDYPINATASRKVLVDGVPQEQWSVGWASDGGAQPSWESTALLKKHFPDLHLVDKVALVDGGVDRNPTSSAETRPTLEHGEDQVIDDEPRASTEQVGQPNNKPDGEPKGRKKPAQPTKERPKRNANRPSKYKDFVPK